jgi:hypothetical protein
MARADVLVEQFRPGVMARLGLDYASVSAINPRIIYCSITGYGQTGPKRDVAAHDVNYIAESGLLSLSMGPLSHPVVPPALIADIAGGSYPAVMNILLALREREHTGTRSTARRVDERQPVHADVLGAWPWLRNGRVAGQRNRPRDWRQSRVISCIRREMAESSPSARSSSASGTPSAMS